MTLFSQPIDETDTDDGDGLQARVLADLAARLDVLETQTAEHERRLGRVERVFRDAAIRARRRRSEERDSDDGN